MLILDFDAPLCACSAYSFFDWALTEKNLRWNYRTYCETGNWQAATGLAQPQLSALYDEFFSCDGFPEEVPTSGAREALEVLLHHDKMLSTSRGEVHRDTVVPFIERNYHPFADYHFNQHDKIEKLLSHGPYFFVDDNLREIKAAANLGVQVFLFPTRGCSRLDLPLGIKPLDADLDNRPDISQDDWDKLTCNAWAEIIDRITGA